MQTLKSKRPLALFIIIILCLMAGTAKTGINLKLKELKKSGKKTEDSPGNYPYSKKISCETLKNTYRFFYLDEEVYRHSREDLADLRIADGAGDFAPYYIEHGATEYRRNEVLFNSKKIAQKIDRKNEISTFDFQIIPGTDTHVPSGSRLILTLDRSEYSKQVTIYGRYADTSWEIIKRDSIYRFDSYKKNYISANGDFIYPFYRVEMIDNNDPLAVTGLQLAGSTDIRHEKMARKTGLEYSVSEKGTDTIVAIKNPDRLKIFNLALGTGGTFKRNYTLYIIDEQRDPRGSRRTRKVEVPLCSGEIYSFDFKKIHVSEKSINLVNDPLQNPDLYLRIENNNDKPLSIEGIDAAYYADKVIFKSTPNRDYRLYFGNPGSVPPVYDVASYRAYIDREDKDACSCEKISGETGNAISEPILSGTRMKVILNVTIAIISLLLVIFLVRQLAVKK